MCDLKLGKLHGHDAEGKSGHQTKIILNGGVDGVDGDESHGKK